MATLTTTPTTMDITTLDTTSTTTTTTTTTTSTTTTTVPPTTTQESGGMGGGPIAGIVIASVVVVIIIVVVVVFIRKRRGREDAPKELPSVKDLNSRHTVHKSGNLSPTFEMTNESPSDQRYTLTHFQSSHNTNDQPEIDLHADGDTEQENPKSGYELYDTPKRQGDAEAIYGNTGEDDDDDKEDYDYPPSNASCLQQQQGQVAGAAENDEFYTDVVSSNQTPGTGKQSVHDDDDNYYTDMTNNTKPTVPRVAVADNAPYADLTRNGDNSPQISADDTYYTDMSGNNTKGVDKAGLARPKTDDNLNATDDLVYENQEIPVNKPAHKGKKPKKDPRQINSDSIYVNTPPQQRKNVDQLRAAKDDDVYVNSPKLSPKPVKPAKPTKPKRFQEAQPSQDDASYAAGKYLEVLPDDVDSGEQGLYEDAVERG